MALRLSTGLRNRILDTKASAAILAVAATTISFSTTDGPNGGDKITDSGNHLANAKAGMTVTVYGSTSNNGTFNVISNPGTGAYVEVSAGSLVTEASGDAVTIATASGGSMSDLFRNGVMRIFPGTQPTNADTTEGTTHIVEISNASQTFVVGGTNGINFGTSASGVLGKTATEVWSGVASGTNTAGWFRMYDKTLTTGASTSAIRFDGAIATTGSQLNMSNTSITSGGTTTIDSGAITLPTL